MIVSKKKSYQKRFSRDYINYLKQTINNYKNIIINFSGIQSSKARWIDKNLLLGNFRAIILNKSNNDSYRLYSYRILILLGKYERGFRKR